MKRGIAIYVLLLIPMLLPYNRLAAQDDVAVTFEMKLSKDKLGLNERLRVDFEMNKDGDNFVPPSFEGFQVIMGPSQSISSSWINGIRSFSKTYSYTLSPTARGKYRISQATIVIGGQTYKTLPLDVEVTAAVDKPSDQLTVDDIADDNLHLVAEVSKSTPYLNEAISVVYKLYVSPAINVSNFRPLDNPTYNNFWSQDMPFSKYNIQNGTYDGKSYRYVVLKRVVLYPQKSGQLEIEPLSLDVTLDVPTSRRDFFGGRVYSQTNKTVSAGRRTINVKPLPSEGKPVDFSGAVGDFNFSVTTTKTQLKASESLQAKVEVKGKGNLKLFQLPNLILPASLEVYEPEFEEHVNTTLSGMQGSVSNTYTIIPSSKGKYPMAGVSFSYFNPDTGKYSTLGSREVLLDVTEGPAGVTSNPVSSASSKQPVLGASNQFNFIKLDPALKPTGSSYFFGSTKFILWMLLPVLFIPLAILFRKRRETIAGDVAGNKIKRANKLARRYLSKAQKELGNKEAFYIALEKALHNYLKAKLKIETTEFTKDKIAAILMEKDVDVPTSEGFISLLKNCEMARYSPFSEVQMQEDYSRASEVISSLDKQL